MIDREERKESIRKTLFAVLGVSILALTVALDIFSEMKFTEETRQGVYERASQNVR